ncbi:hypothetical protein C8F04DRAFT_1252168 [Mycena alexandri]|uniref:Uncharacterized protein n=1 Tax=Mycena alexandri TaxID=1745969 RepID=A0AAD6TBY1_9AGAR|nr:hypothetical protein C8F04DRAFT_1252168 [Mycena alexandri]
MASSSPPRGSSPVLDDDDEYSNLMSSVTPVSSPARKRTAGDADLDSDTPSSISGALIRPNGNHLQAVSGYATRKRFRPEQVAEVETFLNDPFPVQMAKLFVNVKANENALAKFQAAKPKFEINSDLKTNLTRATNATLCSSQITQYKGEAAKNDVQTLLTRHRWGNFVAGTEHDKAAMDVVLKFIGDVLTQSRSTIKKEVVKSVEVAKQKKTQDPPSLRPDHTHTTIYQLTKTIVQKLSGGKAISIPITPALCARVAMMRKWHVRKIENKLSSEDAGKNLWELVDQDLQKVRTAARKDTQDSAEIAKRVAKAFAAILDKDRKRHGSNPTEEIPDATDDALISYQADIDETIEARSHGQTVSMGEGGGEAPDEHEGNT